MSALVKPKTEERVDRKTGIYILEHKLNPGGEEK